MTPRVFTVQEERLRPQSFLSKRFANRVQAFVGFEASADSKSRKSASASNSSRGNFFQDERRCASRAASHVGGKNVPMEKYDCG